MDPDLLLGRLRRELGAFRACLDDDGHRSLSAPVTHCGEWTLHDLAAHLGRGNLWAVAAVTEGRGGLRPLPAPGEPAAPARWFDGTCAVLLDALAADPSAPAWTFHPPHTVGFWRRRRALETLVHRWDAEHALGAARPPDRAVRLTAADTGASWTYGPGAPAATLSAPAERLLPVLWGRLPADGGAVAREGDRAAGLRVLAGPLVP